MGISFEHLERVISKEGSTYQTTNHEAYVYHIMMESLTVKDVDFEKLKSVDFSELEENLFGAIAHEDTNGNLTFSNDFAYVKLLTIQEKFAGLERTQKRRVRSKRRFI